MLKQWRLIFDEIAISGSLRPAWPAVTAICVELTRQGFFSNENGSFGLTGKGLDFYKVHRGDFLAQALARAENEKPR